jgi:hypothetical protein
LVSLVLNLTEEPFESLVYVYKKTGFSLRFSSDYISQNPPWGDQIYEFIKVKDEFNEQLQKEIQKNITTWPFMPDYLLNQKISNISSGEYALIRNTFANLNAGISIIKTYPFNLKSILLILDEPDCTFHIRWSQQFVKYLILYLNKRYPEYSFQIIMTSHMPFLSTDFPRNKTIK